jgi:hypothetical protein
MATRSVMVIRPVEPKPAKRAHLAPHRRPSGERARGARLAGALVIGATCASVAWAGDAGTARASDVADRAAVNDEVNRSDLRGAGLEGTAPPPPPWQPPGVSRFGAVQRPDTRGWARVCSLRHPACVHAPRSVTPARTLETLAAVETAWDATTLGLALPPPDPDPATGAYDVYLVPGFPLEADTAEGARTSFGGFDRTSAFSVLAAELRGCALALRAAEQMARAIALRVAPGTDPPTARAQASYVARLVVPCAFGDPDGIELTQAAPERALVDPFPELPERLAHRAQRGGSLFWWWLDATFGAEPGALVRGAWALAPTKSEAGASAWSGTPDAFDVLRTSFKGALRTGSTFDDLLLAFAVGRAFAGARDDGFHFVEAASLGTPASVDVHWSVPFPDKPRRLAGPSTAPTGATYVAVRTATAPPGARLRVELEWEEHAKMRWSALKLGSDGRVLAQVLIGAQERAVEAQATIAELDGVATVLLVGAAAGEPREPFDPHAGRWEPHAFLVTLAPE